MGMEVIEVDPSQGLLATASHQKRRLNRSATISRELMLPLRERFERLSELSGVPKLAQAFLSLINALVSHMFSVFLWAC
jgi:hypothetical protein